MKSAKKDQSLLDIRRTIEKDNVGGVISKIKDFLGSSPNNNCGIDILRSINSLVYKSSKSSGACQSSPKDIFTATELCCHHLSDGWNVPVLLFVQCLYHIKRYLLNQGFASYARRLCEYYFLIKKEKFIVSWESQEANVIFNTLYDFSNYLDSKFDKINDFLNDNDNSYLSWTQFMLSLVNLNGGDKLNHIFSPLVTFLQKANAQVPKADFQKILPRLLKDIEKWFWENSSHSRPLNLSGKNGLGLVLFLHSSIFYIPEDGLLKELGCDLVNLLKSVESNLSVKNGLGSGIELLLKVLSLPKVASNTSSNCLEDLSPLINNKDIVPEVYQLTLAYMFKIKNALSSYIINGTLSLEILLKNLIGMYKKYLPTCNSSNRKTVTELVNYLYVGLFLVYSCNICKDQLSKVYKSVKLIFQEMINIPGIVSSSYINFGVSGCLNTTVYYKKAELFSEATSLCKMVWKFILKVPSENPNTDGLQECIKYMISICTGCFDKIGCTSEAQVALIGLCIQYPAFLKPAFKAWAELKNSCSSSSPELMGTTAYDITRDYKDVLESEWNCNVKEADVSLLLLHEIQAYAKYRSLHKEPVLSVYRKSAKVVQDKYRLAQILISAIDATTSQQDLLSSTNNFELSVRNIMLFFEKQLKTDNDPMTVCLMATLYYQLARCEIMTMRKNTENEVNLLDIKTPDVPVLQANEGDPLDETSVPPAFSNLTSDKQQSIIKKLDKSLTYWSKLGDMELKEGSQYASSLSYLKPLGYLFRLYCYKRKEVETWNSLYKIAEKISNSKHQVIAVAELLSVSLKVDKELIDRASTLINTDPSLNSKSYVHQLFLVNLSKNLFFNKKHEESYQLFRSLDVNQIKYNFLVFVQLQYLSSLLHVDMTPVFEHAPISALCPAVTVYENLLYMCKFSQWNSFSELCVLHCLLLDISLFLGGTYENMNYVRYARCYSKYQLTLAQRLALPIRVCQLLLVLAWSDMNCFNSSECDIKLRGIEAILEFDTSETCESPLHLCDNPSSPRLLDTVNCTPTFLSHPASCSCPLCSNIDYQLVTLQTMTLRANFLASSGSKSLVTSIFKAGKELIKFTESKLSNYDGILLNIAEVKAKFYVAMSTTLSLREKFEKALKYNSLALSNIEEMPVPNIVFRNCVLHQRNCIQWIQTYKESRESITSYEDEKEESLPLSAYGLQHTPENRGLPVPIAETPKDNLPTTPKFHRRPLVLNLDRDIEVHPKQSTSPHSQVVIPTIVLDETFTTPANKRSGRLNLDQDTIKMPFPKTCPKPIRSGMITKDLFSPAFTPKLAGSKSTFKVFCDNNPENTRKATRSTAKKKPAPSASTTKKTKPEVTASTQKPSKFDDSKTKVERKLFLDDSVNIAEDSTIFNQTDKCNMAFIGDDFSDSFINKSYAPMRKLENKLNFGENDSFQANDEPKPRRRPQVLKFDDSDEEELCFDLEKAHISEKKPKGKSVLQCGGSDTSVIDSTPPPESQGSLSKRLLCVTPKTPQLMSKDFKRLNLSSSKVRKGTPSGSQTPTEIASANSGLSTPVSKPVVSNEVRTTRVTRGAAKSASSKLIHQKPTVNSVTKSRYPK